MREKTQLSLSLSLSSLFYFLFNFFSQSFFPFSLFPCLSLWSQTTLSWSLGFLSFPCLCLKSQTDSLIKVISHQNNYAFSQNDYITYSVIFPSLFLTFTLIYSSLTSFAKIYLKALFVFYSGKWVQEILLLCYARCQCTVLKNDKSFINSKFRSSTTMHIDCCNLSESHKSILNLFFWIYSEIFSLIL